MPEDPDPNGDSDGDGVPDDVEYLIGSDPYCYDSMVPGVSDWFHYYFSGEGPHATDVDADGDGLGAILEAALGTSDATWDTLANLRGDRYIYYLTVLLPYENVEGAVDMDGDGLSALLEQTLGMNDESLDSDGDGLSDADEWASITYSCPWKADTDGDLLDDGDEHSRGTHPRNVDTDDDGLPDGLEVSIGTDPLKVDTDGDHLTDMEEYNQVFGPGFDPLKWSTQDDGLPDFLRADLTDTDAGGIPDRLEVYWGLDPANRLDDYGDIDGDGISNLDEYLTGHDIWNGWLDGLDTDNDGMTNVFEIFFGLDPDNLKDAADDPDGDFLTNQEESMYYTSPWLYLTPKGSVTMVFDLHDQTGLPVYDAQGQPVSRPAANDFETAFGRELVRNPPGRPPIIRDNGPDPDHEWDDDWDQDGFSNYEEMFPPPGINPSQPLVHDGLHFTTPAIITGEAGSFIQFEAAGGRVWEYTFSSSSLPAGLALDSTGLLTIDEDLPGDVYQFTVTVTNTYDTWNDNGGMSTVVDSSVSRLFHLNISGTPYVCPLCNGPDDSCWNSACAFCGEPCGGTCQGSGGGSLVIYGPSGTTVTEGESFDLSFSSNGTPPFSWDVSGSAGVSIDYATGHVSGTGGTPGDYTFTVTLQDGASRTASATYSLTVVPGGGPGGGGNPSDLIIISPGAPDGEVNTTYSHNFGASGGTLPYSWSRQGSLPPGLSFSGGVLSGTPTEEGYYTFSIQVTDNGGLSLTQDVSVLIELVEEDPGPGTGPGDPDDGSGEGNIHDLKIHHAALVMKKNDQYKLGSFKLPGSEYVPDFQDLFTPPAASGGNQPPQSWVSARVEVSVVPSESSGTTPPTGMEVQLKLNDTLLPGKKPVSGLAGTVVFTHVAVPAELAVAAMDQIQVVVTTVGAMDGTVPNKDKINPKVVLWGIELATIGFQTKSSIPRGYGLLIESDDQMTLYQDTGGATGGQWLDKNGDMNATNENGERNWPIAFKAGDKMSIRARLKVPVLPPNSTISVIAECPGKLHVEWPSVNPTNGNVDLEYEESTIQLPSKIQCYSHDSETDAFEVTWKVQINSGGYWTIGSSKHTLYVPLPGFSMKCQETILFIACKEASKGNHTERNLDLVKAVFKEFEDLTVCKVKPTTATPGDIAMQYNHVSTPPQGGAKELVLNGKGRCGGWADLFLEALTRHGIYGTEAKKVSITPNDSAGIMNSFRSAFNGPIPMNVYPVMFIKNWNAGDEELVWSPIDESGIPAQGNEDPSSVFVDHAVIQYGNTMFDPSYGKSYQNPNLYDNWENAALDYVGVGKPSASGLESAWAGFPNTIERETKEEVE